MDLYILSYFAVHSDAVGQHVDLGIICSDKVKSMSPIKCYNLDSFIIPHVGECNVQFNIYFCRQAGMQTICSFHFRLVQFPNSDDNTNFQHICHGHSKAQKKAFDKNACGCLSESSWHVNPILQILALSEKHPKIWGLPGNPLDILSQQQVGDRWGSQGGRRHLNSFHDLRFLWVSSKNRQKRRKKDK